MSGADKQDVAVWAEHQADLIRNGSRDELDLLWIADQLAGIRHHQQETIRHALADLCTCIALRRARPQTEVFCRMGATEATMRLAAALEASPSLLDFSREFLPTAWSIALGRVEEMHPAAEVVPDKFGYSIQALLNHLHHEELEIRSKIIPVLGRWAGPASGRQTGSRGDAETKEQRPFGRGPVEQEPEAHPS
jgi:hypothetical protein